MARILILLTTVGWLGSASAHPVDNTSPLAFGMTPQQVEAAIGTRLVYVSGRRGAEVFVAERDAGVPGFYPVATRVFLQFRRGALTGWRQDWMVTRPFGPF